MASPIVKKVLDRLEGEKELKILESNNEIKQPKLWARAKELAEQRHKVYSPDAHGWAIRWYQQKGGVFELDEGILGAASGAVLGGAVGGPLGAAAGAALGSKVDVLGKKKAKVTTGSQPKKGVVGTDAKTSNKEDEAAKAAKRQRLAKAIEKDKLQREHHQKDVDGNTIPHEEIEEAATTRIPAQNGNVYELMYSWRGKTYYCKMFFPQPGKPSKDEVEVALNKVYPSAILRNCYISSVNYGDPYIHAGSGDGFTK